MASGGEILLQLSVDDAGAVVKVKQFGTTLRELRAALDTTAVSVKKIEQAHTSMGRKLHDTIALLGYMRFAVMDVNDVFLRLPMAILKAAGSIEQTKALLSGLSTQLTKTARDAEGAVNFDYITKMAMKAPFEISALADSFVKLKSGGLDPANGSMQALVDSVAKFGGTGETLKRASVAIQQMMGKGVVSMEELRQQLGEAVPTAMADMATGMGLSMAALTKAVSKGTVESADAINKMFIIMNLRSAGAAQEMMSTWNGMVSQFKTRMQLAAEEIAAAGFGPAMKAVAGQVSEAMDSIQFRQLTNSAGEGLGQAVTTLASFAKILIDHAEMIKTAALTWVFYKVSAGVIAPALIGVRDQLNNTAQAYRNNTREQLNAAGLAKASSMEKIQNIAAESRAQMVASAETMAILRAEVAAREAARVATLASYNAANAQALAPRPRGDRGQFISRAAAQEAVDNIARIEQANSQAMRQVKKDLDTATASHGAASLKALEHGNAIDAVSGAAVKGSSAMAALGAAGTMAYKAFNALGGWTTLLNVAITAGIYLWMNWGKAAEEAMERSSRARKGLADQKDLEGLLDADAKTSEKMEKQRRSIAFMLNNGFGEENATKPQKAALAAANAELLDLGKKLMRSSEVTSSARVSVNSENARQEAAGYIKDSEVVITGIRNAARMKENAADAAYAATLKGNGDGKEVEKKVVDQAAIVKRDAFLNIGKLQYQEEIKAHQRQLDDLAVKAKTVDGTAALSAISSIREKLNAAQAALNNINSLGVNKIGTKSEGGAKGRTPMQALLDDLREQKAKLDATLPGLLSSVGKADTVAAKMAALEVKLGSHAKDSTVKDKKGESVKVGPSDAEKNEARKTTKYIAEMTVLKDDLEVITKEINSKRPDYDRAVAFLNNPLAILDGAQTNQFQETLTKLKAQPELLKSLADAAGATQQAYLTKIEEGIKQAGTMDFVRSYEPIAKEIIEMAPTLERALLTLADPLGSVDEKKTGKFEVLLAKLRKTPGDLRDIAGNVVATAAQISSQIALVEKGLRDAATIDLIGNYKTLVEDNRKMGLEIIQDDRERSRQQIEIDNATAAARQANHIKNAENAKVEINIIDLMQTEANRNAILRSEDMRLKTRTPLDKLTDDWKRSMSSMEDASARWADGFIDVLSSVTPAGKKDFGDFVESVALDILKIQLKSSLSEPMNVLIKAGTDKLKTYLPDLASNGPQSPIAAADAASSIAMTTANAEFRAMERATRSAGDELVRLGTNSTSAAAGLAESVMKQSQEAISIGMLSTAFDAGTTSVYAFVAALNASSGSSAGGSDIAGSIIKSLMGGGRGITFDNVGDLGAYFADGGIMSSMGSIPLRQYAAGGIANSPQFSVFGEGDMNEAYVPLPDGRRIPVALSVSGQGQGQGGAPAVTVNVINQSGSPVAAQQGQPRFDGKQMILDVVLTAASQPGGFRDGLKGAMQ